MSLIRWTPFKDLLTIQDEMNRLFNEYFTRAPEKMEGDNYPWIPVVDIFETEDGKLLVNECQTVFGCSFATTQMKINGKPARYLYKNGEWVLEYGEFCRNHMCNLRVEYLISKLKEKKIAK